MFPEITYIHDSAIDADTDRQIRALLITCFTKDGDEVFRRRRYYKEPYPNRWIIRDEHRAIIAHIGVHQKAIQTPTTTHRFGGIAEVCVHPACQGRGYLKAMLPVIHSWLAGRGFAFGILFGHPDIYRSSGYTVVDNLFMNTDPESPDSPRKPVSAMVRTLRDTAWPGERVFLPGPDF